MDEIFTFIFSRVWHKPWSPNLGTVHKGSLRESIEMMALLKVK